MDELALLLDTAAAQDRPLREPAPSRELGATTALVAHLLEAGHTPEQIASRLELAKATVSQHRQRLHANVGRGYVGGRITVEVLAHAGVKVSELCEMGIGHLRLHDPEGARFRVPDAKTDTGIREVQMSPDLVEAVIEDLDRLRRIGSATGPDAYVVPNLRGGRIARRRVGEILAEAAAEASEMLRRRGLPSLPRVTPHSPRRTYISIALLANNFDAKWVYEPGRTRRLEDDTRRLCAARAARQAPPPGASFDRLIRQARDLHGELRGPSDATELALKRPQPVNQPDRAAAEPDSSFTKTRAELEKGEVARLGIEPRTPHFQAAARTRG
jgi:hypothetical protein